VTAEVVSVDNVDFAVAAYREEGRWVVVQLPARTVVTAVRDGVRLMISDAIALLDWSLAREAAELIGLEWDEEDLEEFEAAGDVSLCVDFGLDAGELIMICQDDDMYPDDQVRAIAKRLGFSEELTAALRSR
jgi:putative tRNA adenosine deaminase-associated protein